MRAGSRGFLAAVPTTVLIHAAPALAQEQAGLDSGDTAWILVSSALVLFMTIPGLALFYGGLVRVKNVLSVLMQCLALTAVITIVWLVCGYSLAFDTRGMEAGVTNLHSFIGSFDKAFMRGVSADVSRLVEHFVRVLGEIVQLHPSEALVRQQLPVAVAQRVVVPGNVVELAREQVAEAVQDRDPLLGWYCIEPSASSA